MEARVSKTFIFFGEALMNLAIVVVFLLLLYNGYVFFKNRGTKGKFSFQFFDFLTLLLITVFSMLGFTIGLLVGYSISPVVHVVVPALLTFYGGFLTYIFSKDSNKDSKRIVGILLSALAVSFFLMYGVEIGAGERNTATASQKKFDLYYLEQEEAIKKKYK